MNNSSEYLKKITEELNSCETQRDFCSVQLTEAEQEKRNFEEKYIDMKYNQTVLIRKIHECERIRERTFLVIVCWVIVCGFFVFILWERYYEVINDFLTDLYVH